MDGQKRRSNERKYGEWSELPSGGRRYWYDVRGRLGWTARYVKEVDAAEETMGLITSEEVIAKLAGYLQHELRLDELVLWAEEAMMERGFEQHRSEVLLDIVSRLGVADVKAFGLTWEDCEAFLHRLGCTVRVEIAAR